MTRWTAAGRTTPTETATPYSTTPTTTNTGISRWCPSRAPQELCIGVSKPVDMTLTILNKAVLSLPNDELQAMVYRNAVPRSRSPWTPLLNPTPCGGGCGGAGAGHRRGAGAALPLTDAPGAADRAGKPHGYTELCELLDEHLFDYDYRKDRLTLAAKSAQAAGRTHGAGALPDSASGRTKAGKGYGGPGAVPAASERRGEGQGYAAQPPRTEAAAGSGSPPSSSMTRGKPLVTIES